jgi:hypothetical protein
VPGFAAGAGDGAEVPFSRPAALPVPEATWGSFTGSGSGICVGLPWQRPIGILLLLELKRPQIEENLAKLREIAQSIEAKVRQRCILNSTTGEIILNRSQGTPIASKFCL